MDLDLFLPYNSVNNDRVHTAEDIAAMFASVMTNGVHPNPGSTFAVTAGGGWNISVAAGRCVIDGRLGANNAAKTLAVTPPSGSLGRVDLVVLRHNATNRKIDLYIKQGTPSANPARPALTRDGTTYELAVAQVSVGAAATSIQAGVIADLRNNSNLCGYINSLIRVDADTLFAQYDAVWRDWLNKFVSDLDAAYSGFVASGTAKYNALATQMDVLSAQTDALLAQADALFDQFLADITANGVDAQTAYEDYRARLEAFTQGIYESTAQWVDAFEADATQRIAAYMDGLLNELTENQAVNLFNRLYAHEESTVGGNENGAHGLRLEGGAVWLQKENGSWVKAFTLPTGLSWRYRDALDRSWGEWDALALTWREFEDLYEEEAG